jgi:hypothetical protein
VIAGEACSSSACGTGCALDVGLREVTRARAPPRAGKRALRVAEQLRLGSMVRHCAYIVTLVPSRLR